MGLCAEEQQMGESTGTVCEKTEESKAGKGRPCKETRERKSCHEQTRVVRLPEANAAERLL